MTARLVVLVSGNGSNLQAVIDATTGEAATATGTATPGIGGATGTANTPADAPGRGEVALDATVVGVVSNRPDAFALQRAQRAGIPTAVAPHHGIERAAYDHDLAYTVASYAPDLVVLAGWDRVLTSHFVAHHRTINLHPAKPGTFPGLGAIAKAFAAWQRGEITEGGVMVHYVPDEGIDNGPVIAWRPVPFQSGDTLTAFTQRVHTVEHELLVEAIGIALTQLPAATRFVAD